MKTLPNTVKAYKQTAVFNQDTVPKGLLKDHSTKTGVWGKITLLKGEMQYSITEGDCEEVVLSPEKHGVVEPKILHYIKPLGEVEFFVEFYR